MKKRLVIVILLSLALVVTFTTALAAKKFDEWGYNRTARVFKGTGWSWCMGKFDNQNYCESYLGGYADDKLVMKWNSEWDRGNDENWSNPPYDAWLNNQWNGKGKGGSGEVWHYKFVWVGDCVSDPGLVPEGGYCLWEQFAVLMDQGTAGNQHSWLARAKPAGYGFYP